VRALGGQGGAGDVVEEVQLRRVDRELDGVSGADRVPRVDARDDQAAAVVGQE
jgi:hypothetical protein